MTTTALDETPILRALARDYPTAAAANAQIVSLSGELLLPLESVHVISDVHGDCAKLRHVINNASGKLRPLVERLFTSRLTSAQRGELLAVLYYPKESLEKLKTWLSQDRRRRQWVAATLRRQFELVREMAGQYRLSHVIELLPAEERDLFMELIAEPLIRWESTYTDEMLDAAAKVDVDLNAVRGASHLVRNLAYRELIVAGDLGDRGPRIDRVIDLLQRQPNVRIVWGNHDAHWMGACLGQEALIASVLRFSTRYGRLDQLEEGYGIALEPLEKLAREIYGDDPCKQFQILGDDLRDADLGRRMQKAIAIMQFKLEGQTSRRHPEWNLENRCLLHRIDRKAGTVQIGDKIYPLLDKNFPTLDAADPYALSAAEKDCMARLRQSFISSQKLWQQMQWVVERGKMWMASGSALIFHACVPVDAYAKPLELQIDGKALAGRAQFDALETIVRRAFRAGAPNAAAGDVDWIWYLWYGDRSPLFGKDKMATFEEYFVADESVKVEKKNPYFELINNAEFCKRIGRDFGMGDDVLIVNGHVPVKIEKGENPIKKGGNAVTIDGAFSQAYGDHGYTLILDSAGIHLAEHAHFQSIADVIDKGADMVPKWISVRKYDVPRTTAQGSRGKMIRDEIALLQKLAEAYRNGLITESL
jgi:fructose-1,6-bisphosphatase-3